MKKFFLIAMAAALPTLASAQPVQGNATQSPQGPGGNGPWREKMKDNLPPEIRDRFEAARQKAMQDPAIQALKQKADAAGEEFRKAMREAMMKTDPGLAEILKERFKDRLREGKPGEPPGFAQLSETDRQKLMAAREKAKDDPAVVAAEAKKNQAQTPEERRAAMEEFHKAMKAALLKVDPTIAPILQQLKPPQGPAPSPDSHMGPPPHADEPMSPPPAN